MSRLIVLEGTDGSGKGTQTALLAAALERDGIRPAVLSFPDYESDSSAPVRMYLAGQIAARPEDVNPYAASSFYSVDRYISFKMKWEKLWRADGVILSDRYTTSNVTHQMEKLPREEWATFTDWLYAFEYDRLGLPRPDLVLYLDMHEALCRRLLEKRYAGNTEKKDLHERDAEYLVRCRRAALCAADRLGWQVVRCFTEDPLCLRSEEDIAGEIYKYVKKIL